jgi:hypothetical protein
MRVVGSLQEGLCVWIVDDDNASYVTMTTQDSNPSVAAAQTNEFETPSTLNAAAFSMSSPQQPSKAATIRRTPFAQPTKLDYNFVIGTTSPVRLLSVPITSLHGCCVSAELGTTSINIRLG